MNNRKILVVLIIGIFIVSSIGGFLGAGENISDNSNENTDTTFEIKSFNLNIGEPTFSYQDVDGSEYITIELDASETFMSHSGEPMLPVITKTFDFPVGTKINTVNVNINWERLDLDKKVTPTPVMIPTSTDIEIDPNYIAEKRINENIYSSAELYPTEPYTIKYGAGLNDNMEHVLKVNVKCFPQYSPANNYVNIPKNIAIDIEYEPAVTSAPMAEQYDLIIITHDVFKDEFQRLVPHKISHGITTKLVTVDEIYDTYDGAGEWEEVKMYLAEHVLEWDTKYVLLGGGHIGQTYDFYVPDFRSNNFDINDDPYEPHYDVTYSCDLYYADVYYPDQYGHFQMDNWDSNHNGIYAEGPASLTGTDVPDYYCDVGLGRIPCRYEWEADIAVDKIIDYENNAKDSWFKRALVAGGDGFPQERYPGQATPGIWEGEIMGDYYADIFADAGVETYKMYCSPTNPDEWLSNNVYSGPGDFQVTKSDDVAKENSKGYGFSCLDGHANPWSLGSYKPDTGIMPPKITEFYTGFNLIQFNNKNKLSFFINEGCHNAQFDVCGQWLINQMVSENPRDDFVFSRYEWIPHDASSALLLLEGGGAIGVIGNTALGLGGLDTGVTEFVGGWIMLKFAEGFAQAGKEYVGDMWVYGIDGYTDNFDVMYDVGDRKTTEERALLGDPSVKLGGYNPGSLSESDESEETEVIYGPVSSTVPTWKVGDKWTYKLDNIDIDLDLTEDRSIVLKLSTGDLIFEVTEVTSDSYILSLKSNNMDVTIGGINYNFHEEDVDDLIIPEMNLDNVTIDSQLIIDKETLGWSEIDLGLIIDVIENLDNFKALIPGLELPKFMNILLPYMKIPANIELKMEFDTPYEIIQFPLETDKYWGFPANTIKLTIDGSVQSPWLKLLSIVNKFIKIIPDELAQYLPNIDISQILNDQGIDTIYTIDIPEIPADLMPYHDDTTPLIEVVGSENINIAAGSFNAVYLSIMDGNGKMYYSEDTGYLVKVIGYIGEYLPIVDNLNLELISYEKQ